MYAHIPKDHAVIALPIAEPQRVSMMIGTSEETEQILIELPHLQQHEEVP